MDILHPILVHFPAVCWLIVLLYVLTEQPKNPYYRLQSITLVLAAWLSCLLSLSSGLWDEGAAIEHLAQAWMLDNHRFAGIVTTVLATLCSITLLAKREYPLSRGMQAALALTPLLAVIVTLYFGHHTVHNSPWQP